MDSPGKKKPKDESEYTSIQVSFAVKMFMDEKALELRKVLKRSKRVSYDNVLKWLFGLDKEEKQ
ncbi:MAG: hypothetical protein M0Q91_12885 [Methanoregula sp.]|nr:hypothetical protein [Methanoregula sp.]